MICKADSRERGVRFEDDYRFKFLRCIIHKRAKEISLHGSNKMKVESSTLLPPRVSFPGRAATLDFTLSMQVDYAYYQGSSSRLSMQELTE
jgi:hypothetical protein